MFPISVPRPRGGTLARVADSTSAAAGRPSDIQLCACLFVPNPYILVMAKRAIVIIFVVEVCNSLVWWRCVLLMGWLVVVDLLVPCLTGKAGIICALYLQFDCTAQES